MTTLIHQEAHRFTLEGHKGKKDYVSAVSAHWTDRVD